MQAGQLSMQMPAMRAEAAPCQGAYVHGMKHKASIHKVHKQLLDDIHITSIQYKHYLRFSVLYSCSKHVCSTDIYINSMRTTDLLGQQKLLTLEISPSTVCSGLAAPE